MSLELDFTRLEGLVGNWICFGEFPIALIITISEKVRDSKCKSKKRKKKKRSTYPLHPNTSNFPCFSSKTLAVEDPSTTPSLQICGRDPFLPVGLYCQIYGRVRRLSRFNDGMATFSQPRRNC